MLLTSSAGAFAGDCDTFKWTEVYGNAKRATASGAWKHTHASKDGGIGTYTVTYTP